MRGRLWRRYARWLQEHPRGPINAVWDMRWYDKILIWALYDPWAPARDREIRYAVECLGIAESDIRDVRHVVNRDAMILRCHNWRRFQISGLDMHNHRARR